MVVNGPGSFTGIRIALTIAKILGRFTNAKIIPISSLKAIALSTETSNYIAPIIDYKKEKMYTAIFDKNYNEILHEQFIYLDEFFNISNKLNKHINFVSLHNYEIDNIEVVKIKYNYQNIYNYYIKNDFVEANDIDANYLKEV